MKPVILMLYISLAKKLDMEARNYTAEVVFDGHVKSQSWLLNYESDATLKNFIHYYYVAKGDGEVVLDSVRYTGQVQHRQVIA
ncbi:hypothetical protein P4S73_29890 [Paraglaciecola sp. Hal342]